MHVNPINDINSQIDQIEWNFSEKRKWSLLRDPQAYLCAVFAAALGLLVMSGCAHQKDNEAPLMVEKHDFPRRY